MREAAEKHLDVHFIAVSHSSQQHTTKWLADIGGTNPSNLEVEVDEQRELFAAWGLGVSSFWHVLNPRGLYEVYRLATQEGIANRPTESGFRFQTSGSWAVDEKGTVVWGKAADSADQIPDFEDAVKVAAK